MQYASHEGDKLNNELVFSKSCNSRTRRHFV